ncbi:carbohydrate porin [Ruegeria sp. HKCCD7296]|uniref:carbohydrate porin n=1 Tax=Ruegeria sp. HKCCD7296 TaxID=2683012 RepID=UPI0014927924|nr:carbohydrate porin [Ruegeria sp. HKCCD7296]
MRSNLNVTVAMARLKQTMSVCAGVAAIASGAAAQENSTVRQLEAAATASLGGPASAQAQLEQDRLRRLENSRLPGLDRFFDPFEQSREAFAKRTGLNLSFDYQALYQKSSDSLSGTDEAASGQARIIGNWALFNRGSENAGSFVFILENRHRLGTDIAPGGLAGEIGYLGVTATTFSDTDSTLSVAYWSQALSGIDGGFVAGRIDPGDYSDILGYVNPRTTFSNFSILFSPVLPIPDPGFGIAGGGYFTDQIYALGVVSDANGSLTDIDWFPGGSEFFTYGEIGWTPARDQRYLTNVHLGVFHVDDREDAGVPSSHGAMLSGNVTLDESVMLFGRLGWSDGEAPIARRAVNAGVMWRPGFYDDLFGFGVTVADPTDQSLDTQTTVEAFYRLDISDNLALTADVQYLNNPGFSDDDPLVFGLRLRFNL